MIGVFWSLCSAWGGVGHLQLQYTLQRQEMIWQARTHLWGSVDNLQTQTQIRNLKLITTNRSTLDHFRGTIQNQGQQNPAGTPFLEVVSDHALIYPERKTHRLNLPGLQHDSLLDLSWEEKTTPYFLARPIELAPIIAVGTLQIDVFLDPGQSLFFAQSGPEISDLEIREPQPEDPNHWVFICHPQMTRAGYITNGQMSPKLWLWIGTDSEWAQAWFPVSQWLQSASSPSKPILEVPEFLQEIAEKAAYSRACFEFVSNAIPYVSIALGEHDYFPYNAAVVLENGYGDCKDKTELFLGLLAAKEIPAGKVYCHTEEMNWRGPDLPLLSRFNHVFPAVFFDGQTHYLDPTGNFSSYDFLPRGLAGKQAIYIQNGTAKRITLPTRSEPLQLQATLYLENGMFNWHLAYHLKGPWKSEFLQQQTAAERAGLQNTAWIGQWLSKRFHYQLDHAQVSVQDLTSDTLILQIIISEPAIQHADTWICPISPTDCGLNWVRSADSGPMSYQETLKIQKLQFVAPIQASDWSKAKFHYLKEPKDGETKTWLFQWTRENSPSGLSQESLNQLRCESLQLMYLRVEP